MDEDAAGGYELAYEEAVRLLSQQREAFESLRGRAGVLISAAAISSSLLGGQAFAGRLDAAGWLAIVSFALLGASVLAILWPTSVRQSAASPARLIETRIETDDPAPLQFIHRDLAYEMDAAHAENDLRYRQLARHFRRAVFLLGVEVLALLADVANGA